MEASARSRFEEGCAAGALRHQQGPDGPVFPPRAGIDDWRDSRGEGTVHSVTWIHPRGGAPRNVCLIDLDEGFRMMSRVDADAVDIGMRVRVRFDDGVPVFVPA
jgi:uncharacterized protein